MLCFIIFIIFSKNKNMSVHLQPPVPLVTLVKTEPPTVIKYEPLEEALEEEISISIKDIDIAYHPLSEDLIKSETVLEDILENKYLKSVQTQTLVVKTENSPFIKTENISERNKSEDTSDGNVSKGSGQEVVEVQASNEHSKALSNLETDEQSILNFSSDISERFISVRSRKSKKTDFAECYKTDDTTLWEKEKEKIKVIKAPVIPIEAHEYTSLAKDKHVCNHCQYVCKKLSNLKKHIEKIHREVTTMYQCPYCPYKSKWSVREHIISKHKDTKDIQWFHYHCDNCHYKTGCHINLKRHKLIHLKPEEIEYFYCYHCSHKNKYKQELKTHIFRHHFKNVKQGKRHHCDKCDYKTYQSANLKRHEITHLKPEEIQYFYCYHCSYKSKEKGSLKRHIFTHHFKNVRRGKRHHCDKCNYKTVESTNFKNHKLTHLKPEEIQYFYCHHCSFKTKWKESLKTHIFKHFKKEQVKFDCYICNFVTLKRESITKHIKKHSKVQNKSEINEGS